MNSKISNFRDAAAGALQEIHGDPILYAGVKATAYVVVVGFPALPLLTTYHEPVYAEVSAQLYAGIIPWMLATGLIYLTWAWPSIALLNHVFGFFEKEREGQNDE